MRRLIERIVLIAVALTLLITGGYYFYRHQRSTFQFETVFEHTVPRTLYGTGVAIRSEVLIEASSAGVQVFPHDDATRFGIGQVVAEFHQYGDGGMTNQRRLREIEHEILMLTEAQDRNVNNMSSADAINRDIRDSLGTLRHVSATGQARELENVREDLASLINRRRIAIGEDENFSERIAQLNEERISLGVYYESTDIVSVHAPVTGFFSRTHDGYESLINPAIMRQMGVGGFMELIERPPPHVPARYVGRMVTSEIWHFAVPLELHSAEWLSRNQRVELEFDMSGRRVPAVVEDILFENNIDEVVAIFRSNHMSEDIINLRINDVLVYSTQHTGLRISNSALHFRETPGGVERGVYVLEGNVMRFRTVHPIYEGPHFFLSDPNPVIPLPSPDDLDEEGYPRRAAPPVRMFDMVVTRGVDLYDGRPVA